MKNKELPLYIAHRVNHKNQFKVYQLGKNPKFPKAYVEYGVDHSETGFEADTLLKYPCSFLEANSFEMILEEIRRVCFVDTYGPKEKENAHCSCPECGYQFEFIIRDYEGLNEEYKETVHCICGCRFRANIEQVKIIWKVEKL